MTQTVTPFLMFEGEAGPAMDLYVSLFEGAEILTRDLYGPGEAGPEGQVKHGAFVIGGQTVRCIDSPIRHDFSFTPASSLFVDCASEAEIDRLAAALGDSGRELMPLGGYGFSRKFAWVDDRFGVSWQLNLV